MSIRLAAALLTSALAAPAFAGPVAPAASAPSFENELTVWVFPAPRPAELSWRTPGGLIRRVVTNAVGEMAHVMNRKLGHMGVTLKCAAANGQPAFTWQGSMTNANKAEFQETVVKQGYGAGVLFHGFSGRFETPEGMQKSIDERTQRTGRASWIRYGISPSTCQRLRGWISAFEQAGGNRTYSLSARPRYRGEGAGCSAFSMSLVEQAGLLEPALRPWTFEVNVPISMIGGPLTGKKIPLARAMITTRGWARPGEPAKHLFGWDPTQAFYWLKKAVVAASRGQRVLATPAVVERRGITAGLVVDRRNVPTPSEPYFKN